MFLSSSGNTHESLGELKKANISCSPTEDFYLCFFLAVRWSIISSFQSRIEIGSE